MCARATSAESRSIEPRLFRKHNYDRDIGLELVLLLISAGDKVMNTCTALAHAELQKERAGIEKKSARLYIMSYHIILLCVCVTLDYIFSFTLCILYHYNIHGANFL